MNEIEILVVDDEEEMLVSYKKILTKAGYSITTALSAKKALERLDGHHNFLLVVCDLKMPGMDGMEFLSNVKQKHTYLPVIMVTGFGTLDLGVEAVKRGAFDFIEKPFTSKKLLKSIEDALGQISFADADSQKFEGFDNMVGRSAGMRQIFDLVKKVAYGNGSVLVTGESGTGKELVARSIHKHSLRRNQPLIPINCGALPNSLFESELFGYEKGAFTGAFQSKPGLVELANGGTLFLDEVCETPNDLQVKLLRMLEDRKIRRIGGKEEIPVDIRVLTATNLNIEEALKKKLLREDLFFRINTIHIHIPPLRERTEDIPLLISHFLTELNQKYNRQIVDIEPSAVELIEAYEWPGNIRELQNIIERVYYLANPPLIRVSDLPAYFDGKNHKRKSKNWENLTYKKAKEIVQQEFEQEYLSYQLKRYNWNISRTAKECGIDRRTIHRLINKFDLQKNNG
jgi:two-component system response regulator HydG